MSFQTPLQRLWHYVAAQKGRLALAVACILLANVGLMTGPLLLRHAVDDLTRGVVRAKLLYYGSAFIGITILGGVFVFLQRRLIATCARNIEYELANDFYAHLQKLPQGFYHSYRTGDLMSRATSDLSAVRTVVGVGSMNSVNTVFAVALILPWMLAMDWRLTLLAFLPLPLVALTTKIISQRIHTESTSVQEHFGTVANRVQESLAGVRVIRAYVQERAEMENFRQVNRELVRRNVKLIHLSSIFSPLVNFVIGLAFVVGIWYGGRLTLQHKITVGQLFQFTLYLEYLIHPMLQLGLIVNIFQRGMASMARLDEVLAIVPAIADRDGAEAEASDIKEITGEIEFRHLTFAYAENERAVLKDISLRIRPGQTVAFVGSVGAGKSTLVNLVPRLLDAGPGQVLIDGRPIHTIPLQLLRSSIGYVPQETFLFSQTLGANIAFGARSATAGEIERAASEAGLSEDVAAFPSGLQTLVGERGVTLSGGQKQRTAIARALIRRPRVLILDDSMSAVDTRTETEILKHLGRATGGSTKLIVSHRVSTVKAADRIVVWEDGAIVERGTHDELLARGGLYAQLYEKQRLEEELTTS
jgi:ATP-binding cassette subfamily B protein